MNWIFVGGVAFAVFASAFGYALWFLVGVCAYCIAMFAVMTFVAFCRGIILDQSRRDALDADGTLFAEWTMSVVPWMLFFAFVAGAVVGARVF